MRQNCLNRYRLTDFKYKTQPEVAQTPPLRFGEGAGGRGKKTL